MPKVNISKIIIFIVFFCSLFIIKPLQAANNATLNLVLQKSTFFDKKIKFNIVNETEQEFNAVSVKIKFDTKFLKISETNINSSCDLIIKEEIDNENGFYNLICGSSNNKLEIEIVELSFEKLKTGITELNINPESLLTSTQNPTEKINIINETLKLPIIF